MINQYPLGLLFITLKTGFVQSISSSSCPLKKFSPYLKTDRFAYLSVEDRLTNHSAACILQNWEGYRWLATHIGLSTVDGTPGLIVDLDPRQRICSFPNTNRTGWSEACSKQVWPTTEGRSLAKTTAKARLVTAHLIQASKTNG